MLLCWPPLSSCLTSLFLLIWLCCSSSTALCPSNCTCKLNEKGRRKVACTQGGMTDPIPTSEMDNGMEILEITAPINGNRNTLTLTQVFQHFKSLQELYIRRSNLQQIGMHIFWGVPSLRLLDLSENNLTNVFDHNFRGLVNLIELNLDDNLIRIIQSGVFKHLTELRILTLQRNLLEELVPRMFLKLGKLHVLKLSENKFEELNPEVFKDIPELRVLECRGCGLRRINTQIYHLLPYLTHLDLGNNQMQFIASDEFYDLRRLHTLKLDGNQLPVVLEKTFIHQQELKYLCLARNRLAKITNTAFLNLSSLIDLDIGYNKLDRIEMVALQHIADTLQRLVISANLFPPSVIRNILQTVYKVWDLEIAQMRLRHLPSNFLPDRIRKLNVSRNNLTEISVDQLPKQLVELDVSNNKLKGLDERILQRFEQMASVKLTNNSWVCNLCNITAIMRRMNRTNLFKYSSCASPKYLKGRLLHQLQMDELLPCNIAGSFDDDDEDSENSALSDNKVVLVVGIATLLVLLVVCILFVVCSCMRRRTRRHSFDETDNDGITSVAVEKRRERIIRRDGAETTTVLDESELHGHQAVAQAIFYKGEISFKFPLDLTERRISVSTIDNMKKENNCAMNNLPNGTGI